jgi:NADH-quinone oxidoreductase subunit J
VSAIPFYVGLLGGVMIVLAYYVTRTRDLVYASVTLALLGSFNAALIALLGLPIVGVFVVIVYVGAAVMFIIIVISTLGIGTREYREEFRGIATGFMLATALITVLAASGLYVVYSRPGTYSLQGISQVLASRYLPALGVLFIALAATLVEAISIARRVEEA